MNDMEKKGLINQLHHIWNSGDVQAIPEVYSPNIVVHWPKGFAVNASHGFDGIRQAIQNVRSAFPDWHEAVADMIIGDDRVVTRYTSTGTHLGSYAGVSPTGHRMELDEISIFRIEAGRVVEQWCLSDDISTLIMLGLLSESPDF